MSSTSHKVYEMFIEKGIVRVMGQQKIAQILIFPNIYDSPASDDKSCSIHTLQTACYPKEGKVIMTGKGAC